MKRKGTNGDGIHIALRFLTYLRIGLYNVLWALSQNSVLDDHSAENGPRDYLDPGNAHHVDRRD